MCIEPYKISDVIRVLPCRLVSEGLMVDMSQRLQFKVIKLFFMLNSAETKIYPAHKCQNANDCWHFNIYQRDKSQALVI